MAASHPGSVARALAAIALTSVGCGSSSPSGAAPDASTDAFADASPEGDAVQTPRATGVVGDWQTVAPMPVARANHCAAFVQGWLVVIGGNRASGGGVRQDRGGRRDTGA